MPLWRWLLAAALAPLVSSFHSAALRSHARARSIVSSQETADDGEAADDGFTIFRRSITGGAGFKQAVADGLAGNFDKAAVAAELDGLIASAPLVVFIWASSPFSKKALAGLQLAGVTPKVTFFGLPRGRGGVLVLGPVAEFGTFEVWRHISRHSRS